MRSYDVRNVTRLLFGALLAAGTVAMAAAYVLLGHMIVDASAGDATAMSVITAGILVGTLTAYVIHEVGMVLPGVMPHLRRQA